MGTFSRKMMLPELPWLFITPGKCGLCYFLIRLVLGVEEPAPGMSVQGEHLTAQPPDPADRCHPQVLGMGWGNHFINGRRQRAPPSPHEQYAYAAGYP